jgi:hypothetical protein
MNFVSNFHESESHFQKKFYETLSACHEDITRVMFWLFSEINLFVSKNQTGSNDSRNLTEKISPTSKLIFELLLQIIRNYWENRKNESIECDLFGTKMACILI